MRWRCYVLYFLCGDWTACAVSVVFPYLGGKRGAWIVFSFSTYCGTNCKGLQGTFQSREVRFIGGEVAVFESRVRECWFMGYVCCACRWASECVRAMEWDTTRTCFTKAVKTGELVSADEMGARQPSGEQKRKDGQG